MPGENIEGLYGISLENLTSRFTAWKAPQQADFHALIALADIGRQAVEEGKGAAPTGLVFHGGVGPLRLAVPSLGCLQLSGAGVQLQVGQGVKVGSGGLALALAPGQHSTCLAFENGACVLKVSSSGVLQAGGKLALAVGDGVQNSSGVALKLAPARSGLQVDANGLAVGCDPAGGLTIDAEGKLTLDLEFLMGINGLSINGL